MMISSTKSINFKIVVSITDNSPNFSNNLFEPKRVDDPPEVIIADILVKMIISFVFYFLIIYINAIAFFANANLS